MPATASCATVAARSGIAVPVAMKAEPRAMTVTL